MNESVPLRDASVQDIQLELLRRTQFNALDGERVHASLVKHRNLWLGTLLDRPGVANYAEPGHLLMSGLIKLRDLSDNSWNADTLFILTPTRATADQLVFLARKLALNSRGMFSEPAAHLLIRPGPFNGMGVPMVVFGPRGQNVSLEFLLTLP